MTAFPLRQPSIEAMTSAPVYFRYGSSKKRILIDRLTAQAVLAIHNAANADNQAKLARMVSGSPGQLQRVVEFAWKHCKVGG